MRLTREQILGNNDLQREVVNVPEWGGEVLVRELTAEERDDYEGGLLEAKKVGNKTEIRPNYKNVKARMAAKAIINDDGSRLFTDRDVEALGRKSAAAMNRVVDAIERLSGMSKKDIEALEGNSGTAQGDDSPSN